MVDADRGPARVVLGYSGVDTRSKGRDRNRYAAPVKAPTGQIWTVFPLK
ncbi:hypothetical protein NKG05_06065 [Oerskovia sp. M15]